MILKQDCFHSYTVAISKKNKLTCTMQIFSLKNVNVKNLEENLNDTILSIQ